MSDGGVWRTVSGRRIYIANGEDLSTAMANSGKFGEKWDFRGEKEYVEKIEKAVDDCKTYKQVAAIRISIDAQDKIIAKLMDDIKNGYEDGDEKVLMSLRRRLRLARKRLLDKQIL